MNARRAYAALALLTVLTSVTALAQESNSPEVSIVGARFNWAVVPTGADVLLKSGPWSVLLGAGYENLYLGRQEDGQPLSRDYQTYNSPNAQGELRYNLRSGSTTLWAGVAGRVYGNVEPVASSSFPDRNEALFGSLKTGATWNALTVDKHGVEAGTFAELKAEWAPAALSVHATDYGRVDLSSAAFVPLFDLGGETNLLSGYLGLRANVRWIDGAQVPVALLEQTEVRGYYRFLDTKLRSVVTAELRLNGPSLWGPSDVLPIVLAFAEGGVYSGYSDTVSTASGALASVGAGVGVNLFGLGVPVITVGLPLLETAVEPAELWYRIDFSLRF